MSRELTPEDHALACKLAGLAIPDETIANKLGIDAAILRRWISKGKAESKSPYAAFEEEFRKAKGDAQIRLLARVHKAAEEDARAAQWLLERLWPEQYGAGRK